jgi:hypothetical protein
MPNFMRAFSTSFRSPLAPRLPHRKVSTTFQEKYPYSSDSILPELKLGRPTSSNELFSYSIGSFLMNEQHELLGRCVIFDLEGLCAIVPSPPSCLLHPA